jgi:uncharacterized protein (UPF0212 family)
LNRSTGYKNFQGNIHACGKIGEKAASLRPGDYALAVGRLTECASQKSTSRAERIAEEQIGKALAASGLKISI